MNAFEVKLPENIGEHRFFKDDGAPCCSVGLIIDSVSQSTDFTYLGSNWKELADQEDTNTHDEILENIAILFSEEFGYNENDVLDALNWLIVRNDVASSSTERRLLLKDFADKYHLAVSIKE